MLYPIKLQDVVPRTAFKLAGAVEMGVSKRRVPYV